MEHGKHVLCEKPFAVNAKAAEEMIACAMENHVFLMEAMWTRFIPAVQELKQQIAAGKIGEIHQIISDFSYDVPFAPNWICKFEKRSRYSGSCYSYVPFRWHVLLYLWGGYSFPLEQRDLWIQRCHKDSVFLRSKRISNMRV